MGSYRPPYYSEKIHELDMRVDRIERTIGWIGRAAKTAFGIATLLILYAVRDRIVEILERFD